MQIRNAVLDGMIRERLIDNYLQASGYQITDRQVTDMIQQEASFLVHTQKLEDYSKNELVLMLERAGFGEIQIRGDHGDEPATADHKALVFIARK